MLGTRKILNGPDHIVNFMAQLLLVTHSLSDPYSVHFDSLTLKIHMIDLWKPLTFGPGECGFPMVRMIRRPQSAGRWLC